MKEHRITKNNKNQRDNYYHLLFYRFKTDGQIIKFYFYNILIEKL